MKKRLYLIISFIALTLMVSYTFSKSYAGNIKNIVIQQQDTLKYLRDNFITHKEKFLHQPLNSILSQLHLKVKSYKNISPNKLQDTTTKGITLFFEDYRTTSEKLHAQKRVFFLDVYFEDKVSARRSLGLFTKTWGAWLDDQENFYGKFLVKDIVGHK